MKTFQIGIKEKLSRVVFVAAETSDEAPDKAKWLYRAEEIVLDTGDFVGEPGILLVPQT